MDSIIAVGAVLLAAATAFAGTLYWCVRRFSIRPRDWVAASVIFLWCAGVGAKVYLSSATQPQPADPLSAALMLGPIDGKAASNPAPVDPIGAQPSVSAMIGGLQARLERDPSDVKGWALLAQSYAFIGDASAAENALARAVELGADEADLRTRVDGARRDSHPAVTGRVASADL
jgi:cytochrome c-type biogenesis protein CcmH/NrfG